jgi:hypothetical protein
MPTKKKSPPVRAAKPSAPPPGRTQAPPTPAPISSGILKLEPPFDVDDFCRQLGETHLRATVPKAQVPEVLRRILEFMDFGVYVYTLVVLPAPGATLDRFVVQLDRIQYHESRKVWMPFQERGVADNPFGPGSGASGP